MEQKHTPQHLLHDESSHGRYLGSVRFFKHVILTVVALMILIPTVSAIILSVKNSDTQEKMSGLAVELASKEKKIEQLERELGGMPVAKPMSAKEQEPSKPSMEAEMPSYTALYPDMYVEDEHDATVVDNTVYLTFDDGPSSRTPEILDVLREYDVKATFFVIGQTDEQSIEWMKQIVAEGHTLGIHSYSHKYQVIYNSVEDYLADFYQLYTLLRDEVGVTPTIFRFPGGSINGYNSSTWQDITAEMVRRGFVYFDWNVSNEDAVSSKLTPTDKLIANALSGVGKYSRAVVLMHDSAVKTTTVQALPAIIEGYQAAGYSFAPLNADVKPIIYGYPN